MIYHDDKYDFNFRNGKFTINHYDLYQRYLEEKYPKREFPKDYFEALYNIALSNEAEEWTDNIFTQIEKDNKKKIAQEKRKATMAKKKKQEVNPAV